MDKFTIARFNEIFPDEDACLAFVKDMIYPDGIVCRKCGDTKHYKLANRKAYSCNSCGTHVYPLAGTIFEKSSTPLKSWFYSMYLMASTRTGISAKQLERELGVTYKTAWRMFSQIRKLLAQDSEPLFGEIEVDETYIGGKRPGKRGRGAAGKTVVVGLVERKGKALVTVAPDVKAQTLLPIIREHIPAVPGTIIYTDELQSYHRLTSLGYAHETVQHAAKQYVSGAAHVNNVESIWSNVKRGIDGVNHDVLRRRADEKQAEYMSLMHEQKRIEIRLEGIKGYIQHLNGLLQVEGLPIIRLRDSTVATGVGQPGNRSKDMPLRKSEWEGMSLLHIAGTILNQSNDIVHADVLVPLIFEVENALQHKKAKHTLVSTLRAGAKQGLWEALPKNHYRGVTASPRLLGV